MNYTSWSSLSKEELEEYSFRTKNDPRNLWNIVFEKVNPYQLSDIIQYYKYDAEGLPCCICRSARHNNGAVIRIDDGTFRIIGRDCGKAHFGGKWISLSNAFSAAERSAKHRVTGRAILQNKSEILNTFDFLWRQTAASAFSVRTSLKSLFGPFHQTLSRELERSEGRLSYEVQLSADTRRQGGLTATVAHTPQLAGWRGLLTTNYSGEVEALQRKVKTSLECLEQCLEKNQSCFKNVKDILQYCEEGRQWFDKFKDMALYRNKTNIEYINNWINKKGINALMDYQNNKLTFSDKSGSRAIAPMEFMYFECPAAFNLFLREISRV